MSEFLDDEFFADPRVYYRRWRAHGPVHRGDFGDGLDRWLILGYEQGRAVLADPRPCKDIARFCVGAPLDRPETKTAFADLSHRFPYIALGLAGSDPHRDPSPIGRSRTDLPVHLRESESIRNPVGSEDR